MRLAYLIIILFMLVGCGSDTEYDFSCACDLQIKNIQDDYGQADDVEVSVNGEWYTEIHYYDCRGEAYSFTWSTASDSYKNEQCCYSEVTNYNPVCP